MALLPEESARQQDPAVPEPAIPTPPTSPEPPQDKDTKDIPAGEEEISEIVQDATPGPTETSTEIPTEELPAAGAENGGALEDPIEILVGLAERGEIDPWNINIIELTDRFLNELERRRELNLKLSGRTLFYAATLLRMKSEQLLILASPEEGEGEEGEEESGRE